MRSNRRVRASTRVNAVAHSTSRRVLIGEYECRSVKKYKSTTQLVSKQPLVVKSAMAGFTKRVITEAKQRRRKEPLREPLRVPLQKAKYPKPLKVFGRLASRANHSAFRFLEHLLKCGRPSLARERSRDTTVLLSVTTFS